MKLKQCGPLSSIVKSYARYTSEFDAYLLAEGIVTHDEKAHFFSLDSGCSIF